MLVSSGRAGQTDENTIVIPRVDAGRILGAAGVSVLRGRSEEAGSRIFASVHRELVNHRWNEGAGTLR